MFSQNCSADPLPAIEENISTWRERFINQLLAVLGTSHRNIAVDKFQLSLRLYYRVMEALLVQASLMCSFVIFL